MVYTLEASCDAVPPFITAGIVAVWDGEPQYRPWMGLEVVVAVMGGNDFDLKFMLDAFLEAEVEDKAILYSRIDGAYQIQLASTTSFVSKFHSVGHFSFYSIIWETRVI